MGRRPAPGKKRKVQCSPEPVRVTLPSSPVHNVSASRSKNNAERNHQLEPLSGNLPNVILLSMLEKLDAKLDNFQNTLEDLPSRVAGLMEQIWIARDQYHLDNGSVSLEVVSPVTIGEYSFSRSPPVPLSVRAREQNQYLQPTPPYGCEPQQSQLLKPMSPDGREPQQNCTVSRWPPDIPVIPGEPSLGLLPVTDDEQESQQDQYIQLVIPDVHKPEEHLKKEPLYADSWDPQQNFFIQPSIHEEHGPQQNNCRQPVLPDEKEPDEQELLWFDREGPQQNHCIHPAFQEDQSLQHNASLQQVLSAHEQHQSCKTEPMHPENPDQQYDLQQPCTDAHGLSVRSSFLAENTADRGEAITTDPSERGHMESDVLLSKDIPAPQSQRESLNGKEIQHASAGRKNFAHKMNEKKHQRSHKSESSNNDALLGPKRKQSGLGAYPCAECTKTFTGKTHLLLHEKTHTGLIQCPYPEQETRSADEATLIHHEITHKGVRPFQCYICEKSFTQKGNLKIHHRTHTGEKPYQCSLCFMRFAHERSLVYHHTIHTRVKPYHCPVCGKGFDRKERLAGHQRTHPGEKPYQCSVCAKRFNHKRTLAHHQITHRRPFHCSVCRKSFDCKERLLGHQRIHTGKRYVAAQGMKKGFKKRRLLSNIK
ncbi:zinc finger protein interacting with ribonucleoprotein K-like [Pleurodeles waltl]|uniref:zinc finger protein interacting with ribonucleoprotein K-like n=1 Tax=Pleurodeles waltl TaxID=8319 RepID=UPI003709C04B